MKINTISMTETLTIDENEEKNAKDTTEESTPSRHGKPWYTSIWLWVIIGASILIGAGLIWYFGFYAPARSSNLQKQSAETALNNDWKTVVQEAEKLTKLVKRTETIDGYTSLLSQVGDFSDAITTAQKNYQAQSFITTLKYETALNDLSDYAASIQSVLEKKKEDLKDTDFTTMKDKASQAKTSVTNFLSDHTFASETILSDFYSIHVSLKTLDDTYLADLQQKADELKKQQEAEKQKQAEAAAEKSTIETAIAGFTNAYIEGNLDTLKTFMTSSFQDEFNYAQRQDGYYVPSSCRIIDTVKNSETRYYVYGRMTEKVADGTDQFSYDWNFTVIKVGSKWLIDLDQAPTR